MSSYDYLVDGLEETWAQTTALVEQIRDEDLEAETPCPGWSVRDVVNHLIGFERMLAGEAMPTYDGEMPSYVKNPIGEINEAYVAAHRDDSRETVLSEFRRTTGVTLASLRGLTDEQWQVMGWSPEGEAPYSRMIETRLLDSWIHLQDLRDALAMAAREDGLGEEVVINRFEAALPYVVGKKAKIGEGIRVRFNLVGRLARSIDVEVHEGRARASTVPGDAHLEITMATSLFWRRAAGRISADALLGASSTDVRGDRDAARKIAEAMAIMI